MKNIFFSSKEDIGKKRVPIKMKEGGNVGKAEEELLNLLEKHYLHDTIGLRLNTDIKRLKDSRIDWESDDNKDTFLGKLHNYLKSYEIVGEYDVIYKDYTGKINAFQNRVKQLKAADYSVFIKVSALNKNNERSYRFIAVKRKYANGGELAKGIRENKGSGRKPTKEMLEQENQIKASQYKEGGELLSKGKTITLKNQPRDLSELPYFANAYKGAEYYSMQDEDDEYYHKKVKKANRWYELMLKNQRQSKLSKKEFLEFESLSYDLLIEDMEQGGELAKGIKVEKEHQKTFENVYAHKLTPKDAPKEVAKEHIKEDPNYYSKLQKIEKMSKGGGLTVDQLKVGDRGILSGKITFKEEVEITGITSKLVNYISILTGKKKGIYIDDFLKKYTPATATTPSQQTSAKTPEIGSWLILETRKGIVYKVTGISNRDVEVDAYNADDLVTPSSKDQFREQGVIDYIREGKIKRLPSPKFKSGDSVVFKGQDIYVVKLIRLISTGNTNVWEYDLGSFGRALEVDLSPSVANPQAKTSATPSNDAATQMIGKPTKIGNMEVAENDIVIIGTLQEFNDKIESLVPGWRLPVVKELREIIRNKAPNINPGEWYTAASGLIVFSDDLDAKTLDPDVKKERTTRLVRSVGSANKTSSNAPAQTTQDIKDKFALGTWFAFDVPKQYLIYKVTGTLSGKIDTTIYRTADPFESRGAGGRFLYDSLEKGLNQGRITILAQPKYKAGETVKSKIDGKSVYITGVKELFYTSGNKNSFVYRTDLGEYFEDDVEPISLQTQTSADSPIIIGNIERIPSTDASTWDAAFDVGDKVLIRIDMEDKTKSKGVVLEVISYETIPQVARPENPSGVTYKLNNGENWEGKDLELVTKSQGESKTVIGTPESKKIAQDVVKSFDSWIQNNMVSQSQITSNDFVFHSINQLKNALSSIQDAETQKMVEVLSKI